MAVPAKLRPAVGAGVALTLHGVVAAGLLGVSPPLFQHRPATETVELEVNEAPPLPPEPPPAEPPPEPPKLNPVVIRRPVRVVPPTPKPVAPSPEEPPPTPNQEPPREPEPPAAPPPRAFGATVDSVVAGESTVAVPVGNTLMGGRPRDTAIGPPKPYAAGVAGGTGDSTQFVPVPENVIAVEPALLEEFKAPYPEEARRMGLEGEVMLRIGIDENGKIREVRVVKRAGHGFDEQAAKAMWRYRFRPARASDGRPVAVRQNFRYVFQLPR